MDLEPHLIKKQSSELDPPLFDKETDQLSSDDEDPGDSLMYLIHIESDSNQWDFESGSR